MYDEFKFSRLRRHLIGPVKLIQRVKIVHSFLQSVSNLFHFRERSEIIKGGRVMIFCALKKGGLQLFLQLSLREGS